MSVNDEEFAFRAMQDIGFFKVVKGKETVRGADIVSRNDALFITEHIVINAQTLPLKAVFAAFLRDLGGSLGFYFFLEPLRLAFHVKGFRLSEILFKKVYHIARISPKIVRVFVAYCFY